MGEFGQRCPHLDIVLEPGSAIACNTGTLIATVRDVISRGVIQIAMLDTFTTAHMPDVLEMPYRPEVRNAGMPGERNFTYRLGGLTCLAGDVVGDYSFDRQCMVGDKVIFEDMIHCTMVKTTMFNGVHHAAIAIQRERGSCEIVREFR